MLGDIQKIVVAPDSFYVDANLSAARDRNDGDIGGMRKVETDWPIREKWFSIGGVLESKQLRSKIPVAAQYAAQARPCHRVAVSMLDKTEASSPHALVIG